MQTQAKQGFLDRFFKLSEKNTTVKTELLAVSRHSLHSLISSLSIQISCRRQASRRRRPSPRPSGLQRSRRWSWAYSPITRSHSHRAWAQCVLCLLRLRHARPSLDGRTRCRLLLGRPVPDPDDQHIRQAIINAVPQNLRVAIGVGIGLFIAFIGLKGTGLIIPDKATFIGLGHVTNPTTLLSLFGLVLTGALMARNIQAPSSSASSRRRCSRWCSATRRSRTPSVTS